MSSPVPQALRGDALGLTMTWSNGSSFRVTWRQLRDRCPCATCKAKLEAPAPLFAVLKPEETQPIRCTSMEPMGNYAYHINFSDGHNSGIYTFDFLYKLGETAAEQP